MKNTNNFFSSIIAAFCLFLLCSITVIFGLHPIDELPMSFIGAALGAVITGIITLVLLKGQSSAQEVKERNVKIFEKKSKICEEYINLVWKIWEGRKITNDQYQELTSEYYKNLMIYLKKEKGSILKEEKDNSQIIGAAITNLGECLEIETYENFQNIKENIIIIINALSNELGIGGYIDKDQIETHDKKLFIAKFKEKLLDSFNEILVKPYSDILKNGYWLHWEEGSDKGVKVIHDDMVFDTKKYPECSIRIGTTINHDGKKYYDLVFYISDYPACSALYGYRWQVQTRSLFKNRIKINYEYDGFFNIVNPSIIPDSAKSNLEQEELVPIDFPVLDFNDDKNTSIIKIQKDGNYQQIAETFANKAKELFSGKITLYSGNQLTEETIIQLLS